jgi:uncharacterized membrane protein
MDFNQVISIFVHWLHLLSAIIWIGGLAFLVMAVTPGLRTSVPREYIKPITETFYQQYKRMVGVILVIILFTGGINLHYVSLGMENGVSHNAKYLTVFFIKLALVLGVLTVYLYTILFKNEPTGEESEEEREEMVYEPIPFQRGALWMGVFIILCAAAMKHLH